MVKIVLSLSKLERFLSVMSASEVSGLGLAVVGSLIAIPEVQIKRWTVLLKVKNDISHNRFIPVNPNSQRYAESRKPGHRAPFLPCPVCSQGAENN